MLNKKSLMAMMVFILIMLISGAWPVCNVWAEDAPAGDESATFTSVSPDALILLDLSGSMAFGPLGSSSYTYGNSTSCTPDTTSGHCTGTNCSGGFCSSSQTSCTVNCSRLAIAQRGIFSILDDDNNNIINSADSDSLGVRIGFMRYKDTGDGTSGNDTAGDYTSGSIKLVDMISTLGSTGTGTSYQLTYCGNSTSCASTVTSCTNGECVAGETANGGTPLASALGEAKSYLDDHKASDPSKDCRQKFVIMLTDGADTYACSGSGNECQSRMYERRREVVARAKALYDAGFRVYVIGFGYGMPNYLKNTLEWMAYYGGTDNATVTNSGDKTAYNITSGTCCFSIHGNCNATNTAACYPKNSDGTNITSCGSSSNEADGCCFDGDTGHTCGGVSSYTSTTDFTADTNDPGYLTLSGYAFIATNADQLTDALRTAIANIRSQSYSFTRVSVQAVRTADENYIYEASFMPLTDVIADPFWIGHLKRFSLNTDGSIISPADWDAGTILKAQTGSTRTIYTYKGGSLINFNTVTNSDLGVSLTADRDGIVNFIYNGELDTTYNNYGWKLGDIFHSSPISIGTPSQYFVDQVDAGTTKAYDTYRSNNPRTSVNGNRLIVAGANDGQFHVFRTGSSAGGGGTEKWSFIPPNFLTRLQGLYHTDHPTSLDHQYFVDGPATASDVWTGSGTGESKVDTEWKAYMIISEGRGGISNVWSSSQYCDSGMSSTYSSTYNQYCGYYAFDVTDTSSAPIFKWHFGGTGGLDATKGAYLGQPWSKITMNRVKIAGNERWVGFVPAGYTAGSCGGTCDTRGKGFFVIDLLNGNVLWQYTRANDSSMNYSLVGQPSAVDLDDDGFVNTVYAGDLGGNVWRFKFCGKTDSSSCNTSNWTGSKFFSGNGRPIFTKPAVMRVMNGDIWVFFGTGDETDPTNATTSDTMYAVKDDDQTTTWNRGNLVDISNPTGTNATTYDCTASTNDGWYIDLGSGGNKILADSTVYADILYFITYLPGNVANACDRGGDSWINGVDYCSGAGQFSGLRSQYGGAGISSGINVSEGTDSATGLPGGGGPATIYFSTSENARINVINPPDPLANKNNLQYWHDMRVQ